MFRHQFKKGILTLPLIIFTALFFWGAPLAALPAEVGTNDGQKFHGKILEELDDYILMEVENGVQVRIDKSEVNYIEREDIGPKASSQDYPVLGFSFGTPSSFNFVAGYYLSNFGLRVLGAYWGGARGAQADLSLKLVDNQDFLADFSLVAGTEWTSGASNGFSLWSSGSWGGTQWTYKGIGFDINYMGFVFEVDAVTGDFPNPVALPIQAGFVQRFN